MTKKTKKIDIHKDYVMWQLNCNLRQALTCIIAYMQDSTPYGKEYQDALRYHDLLISSLETFEEKLQACVERKQKDER